MLALGAVTPASAAVPAAPVLSNLSTVTPGHLTGTVTSPGEPSVHLSLSGVYEEDINLSGASGTFDIETWGLPPTSTIYARACNVDGCSATTEATIHPTDVVPQVTWSSDQTVGQGQSVDVTVEDSGGGTLTAFWDRGDGPFNYFTVLDKHGTTAVDTPNGTGTVTLYRCRSSNVTCTPFQPVTSHPYTVLRYANLSWDDIGTVTQTHSRTAHFSTDLDGPTWPAGSTYDVSWSILTATDQVVRTGTASGVFGPTQNSFDVPIVSDGLPDGQLKITGSLTVHTADFGDLTRDLSNFLGNPTFWVDRTGLEHVTSITKTHSTIYPRVNLGSYYGSTTIGVKSSEAELGQVAVVSGSGTLVRTLTYRFAQATEISVTWNGKNGAGAIVPAGTYRLYPVDDYGNRGSAYTTVVVSPKTLITKTFRKTVTAAGSLFGAYVGPCSTLARPSNRGWVYSLGYYANTKCGTQTFHSSGVSTGHVVSVPAAARYLDVHVSAYGGPVAGGIPDRAVIRYLLKNGDWGSERAISSGLTWHPGFTVPAAGYVTTKHNFRWGFLDAYKSRYDVKSFTVVLTYQVVG
jgi:hypothetical protein